VACAQVMDATVTSLYRWQGALAIEPEKRMYLHTRVELADQVMEFIRSRHPYEVPNVIALPILAGSAEYFAWVKAQTSSGVSR